MELTTEEFNKIRAGMKSAWPSANIMPDEFAIKLWYGMLKDIPYNVCSSAIMELMSVEKFAPSIAQIREKCLEYTDIPIKDVSEAWSDVMSAVHRYGYYSVPEAMDSLDELTRQAVKGIGSRRSACRRISWWSVRTLCGSTRLCKRGKRPTCLCRLR